MASCDHYLLFIQSMSAKQSMHYKITFARDNNKRSDFIKDMRHFIGFPWV